MTQNWIEPVDASHPADLQKRVGGHPLVANALMQRGFGDPSSALAFLDPQAYKPAAPEEMPGVELAVECILQAIAAGEPILVWGDFDVDGQTATTLLVSALGDLGANVDYHIPLRASESHGVNLPVLQRILAEKPFQLLLTCDTGISAHAALAYASERGLEVIVTDHHELPENLPKASALINPHMLSEDHPLSTLPGVGVAYKMAEALLHASGRAGEERKFLDLVALGAVADVAVLRGDTRYLTQLGIQQLRSPKRLGLSAIYERAELDPSWLTEEHIGFVLAPRLNAIGRLGDANPVVEFLTTSDHVQARLLALQLEGLNSRRQLLTSQITQAALDQVEKDPALLESAVLVLQHPTWPAGVIGIVASRLVERFAKPVVLIATPPGELGRASARSVEGVDISAAIAAQNELLAGYGGHSMAAGFSIKPENVADFRIGISKAVERLSAMPEQALSLDAYLDWSEISLDLAEDLERLAPFGAGNPALVFASRDLRIANVRMVGRGGEHLLLKIQDRSDLARNVVWWGGGELQNVDQLPQGNIDLAYRLRASTFRGQRDVQLEWLDFRQSRAAVELAAPKPGLKIQDYRDQAHPLPVLQRILTQDEDLQVWAEADGLEKLRFALKENQSKDILQPRSNLSPCKILLVWTMPPGRSEWRTALDNCQPEQVILFAVQPGMDHFQPFIERLAGLVKYALRAKGGRLELTRVAGALAARDYAVRLGLEWLAARGNLTICEKGEEVWQITVGGCAEPEMVGLLESGIKDILEETRAYRGFFRRAQLEALVG